MDDYTLEQIFDPDFKKKILRLPAPTTEFNIPPFHIHPDPTTTSTQEEPLVDFEPENQVEEFEATLLASNPRLPLLQTNAGIDSEPALKIVEHKTTLSDIGYGAELGLRIPTGFLKTVKVHTDYEFLSQVPNEITMTVGELTPLASSLRGVMPTLGGSPLYINEDEEKSSAGLGTAKVTFGSIFKKQTVKASLYLTDLRLCYVFLHRSQGLVKPLSYMLSSLTDKIVGGCVWFNIDLQNQIVWNGKANQIKNELEFGRRTLTIINRYLQNGQELSWVDRDDQKVVIKPIDQDFGKWSTQIKERAYNAPAITLAKTAAYCTKLKIPIQELYINHIFR